MFRSPDRWNDLPEKVKEIPGLYNHLLTFSAGPRVSPPNLFTWRDRVIDPVC